jgi:hypothetical protein
MAQSTGLRLIATEALFEFKARLARDTAAYLWTSSCSLIRLTLLLMQSAVISYRDPRADLQRPATNPYFILPPFPCLFGWLAWHNHQLRWISQLPHCPPTPDLGLASYPWLEALHWGAWKPNAGPIRTSVSLNSSLFLNKLKSESITNLLNFSCQN